MPFDMWSLAAKKRQGRKLVEDPFLREVVVRVKEVMLDSGFDPEKREQAAFAKAAGIHQPTLNRVLNRKRGAGIDFFAALAKAGGVRAGWLVFGEPPRDTPETRQLQIHAENRAKKMIGKQEAIIKQRQKGERDAPDRQSGG